MSETKRSPGFRLALNEGAQLLQQNRPQEALAKLLPLQEEAPDDPDVAINVGGAYILQRKWNRAVAVLQEATRRHPENVMLWTNLGAACLGRLETSGPRQQKQAIAAYERALQIDPKAPNVHYHLGLIYKERGEFNRSSAFFQRALEVNPADRDAQRWLDWLARALAAEQRERQEAQDDDTVSHDVASDDATSHDGASGGRSAAC